MANALYFLLTLTTLLFSQLSYAENLYKHNWANYHLLVTTTNYKIGDVVNTANKMLRPRNALDVLIYVENNREKGMIIYAAYCKAGQWHDKDNEYKCVAKS